MASTSDNIARIPADPDALLDYFDRIGSDCSESDFDGYIDLDEEDGSSCNEAFFSRKRRREYDSSSDEDEPPSRASRRATPEASFSTPATPEATPTHSGKYLYTHSIR